MGKIDTIYRSCPTCEASCGLAIEVDRDKNEILSIKGDHHDARSQGYVCAKSQAFAYIHADPERLRHPVKQSGMALQFRFGRHGPFPVVCCHVRAL